MGCGVLIARLPIQEAKQIRQFSTILEFSGESRWNLSAIGWSAREPCV